jgi:hypothetical protein
VLIDPPDLCAAAAALDPALPPPPPPQAPGTPWFTTKRVSREDYKRMQEQQKADAAEQLEEGGEPAKKSAKDKFDEF